MQGRNNNRDVESNGLMISSSLDSVIKNEKEIDITVELFEQRRIEDINTNSDEEVAESLIEASSPKISRFQKVNQMILLETICKKSYKRVVYHWQEEEGAGTGKRKRKSEKRPTL